MQELRGDYGFVQDELKEHRSEYHGDESSEEEAAPVSEQSSFLEKLLGRGLDLAHFAEQWLKGDEVMGAPYHPVVGASEAFEAVREEGTAPGWLWLNRPSGRWQRCWSELRGPILVLYRVEGERCWGPQRYGLEHLNILRGLTIRDWI